LAGPTDSRRRWRFQPLRSVVGKLLLLLVVFLAVPVFLYYEFREADLKQQGLLLKSVREQGRLMAESLRPLLEQEGAAPLLALPKEVKRLATPDTEVKVLYRPKGQSGAEGFFFIAAEPAVPPAFLEREREALIARGVLGNLVSTCAAEPIALRHVNVSGAEELLTSVTPISTASGCWIVITAHSSGAFLGTSIGQPYWKTLEIRLAAITYLGMAALTIGVFVSIWRSLTRFRDLARDIRKGVAPHGGFASKNRVPELAPVAEEFDRMTAAMHGSAESMRRASEDNAHAFKTPIAIIRQSLEPLRRIVPSESGRGLRALDVLEESVDRLDRLVASARNLDEVAAELIDRPRHNVDLSRLVGRMLDAYADSFAGRQVRLDARLQTNVVVSADEELLEVVLENVIDNALSVSPPYAAVTVELTTGHEHALLAVRDQGPGVPAHHLNRIFERYVSLRGVSDTPLVVGGRQEVVERTGEAGEHLGIGLWIVRRNLEAVGGSVWAENRQQGGFSLIMDLPLAA
jgi:two-component system sensor histidine kinase ChvG